MIENTATEPTGVTQFSDFSVPWGTRFAQPQFARLVGWLIVAGVLSVALGGYFLHNRAEPATSVLRGATGTGADRPLFLAVVQRLQQGESYYVAMGTELHARGFPTASIFNWRTPLHLWVLALFGIRGATVVLAVLLMAALFGLLRPLSAQLLVLVAGPVMGIAGVVYFGDAWAGAFVALSVAAYRRQAWALAAFCGVLAVFFREIAVVYALASAGLAFVDRRRVESAVWIVGGVLYALYFFWHAQSVQAAMPIDATAHPFSWVQWGGLPFVVGTVKWYAWVAIAPTILGPLVVSTGLLGVVSSRMSPQVRLALLAYFVAFSIVGHSFNTYWGLVTVPLWALSLTHAAEGARTVLSLVRASEPPSLS
jgi:hypothetical protein